MGYYTKYFSILLKGVRATAWKEKFEARRAVRRLIGGKKDIKRTIDLINSHLVTRSNTSLKKAEKDLKISASYAEKFIFNVLTEDKALVKAEQAILQSLLELSQITPNSDSKLIELEKQLAYAIFHGTKDYKFAEPGERKEYTQVELVINEAKSDKNKFMANLRLMFQKEDVVSMLTRFAMTGGVNREKVDILKLQGVAKNIRSLKSRFKPRLEKEAEAELSRDVKEVATDLKDAFYNTYAIKDRDTKIVLRVLYDLHTLKELVFYFAKKHYIPQTFAEDATSEIEKIEEGIVKDFHTVAQGFRIVIAAIGSLESEAQTDMIKIQRRVA